MQNLAQNIKISYGGAPVAAALNTDQNTARLDMQGFDGVIYLVSIVDSVATGVATLKVEANTANSDTNMAAITGATATVTCAVNDDINGEILVVDVYRPLKRYVQGVITSATADIAFGDTIAIQYSGVKLPVTVAASIAQQTVVVGS